MVEPPSRPSQPPPDRRGVSDDADVTLAPEPLEPYRAAGPEATAAMAVGDAAPAPPDAVAGDLAGTAPPPGTTPDASGDAGDVTPPHGHRPGGVLLGGRYLLEERIASGGMAAVWRAHDEVLARTVAVKVLHGHLAADDAFRERFRREAIAAAKLTHPAVVSVYDTGTDGAAVYLVMEFVDGITLKDVIADSGPLTPGEAASIGERVARALAYAHGRGLVHRDVKPANILIGHDGSVKVADFGIAKAEEAGEDLTKTGMVLGTAAYVAPEQITGQVIDGRADQYALGCVLYEALAGRQPFKGDNAVTTAAQRLDRGPLPLRQVRADVPRGLSAVVDRALARDPEDRYPSATALAGALAAFADADADAERTATLTTAMEMPADTGLDPAQQGAGPDGGEPSFLRSEGRWLAPVLALLALAGALVGVGLATGVLESRDGLPLTFARGDQDPASEAPEAVPAAITPSAVTDFDPLGDGRENPADVGGLLDGDPGTVWQTEGYDTPALGGLKPGVGFALTLAEPTRLDQVTLQVATPGISFQLRVPGEGATDADVAGWEPVATIPDAAATVRADLAGITTNRLLVWITGDLQPSGGRYRAGFSGLELVGAPAPAP